MTNNERFEQVCVKRLPNLQIDQKEKLNDIKRNLIQMAKNNLEKEIAWSCLYRKDWIIQC